MQKQPKLVMHDSRYSLIRYKDRDKGNHVKRIVVLYVFYVECVLAKHQKVFECIGEKVSQL